MKVKVDFVTNSSSSSFVAIGVYMEPDDIIKANISKLQEIHKNRDVAFDLAAAEGNYWELLEDLTMNSGLEFSFGEAGAWGDTESVIIGIEYTSMKEDETLAQFRERVKTLIKDELNIEVEKVHHIEECWRDG